MRKDNPRIYVYDNIKELLYEKPFCALLIGNYKTMNSIDRKKIAEKFKKIYKPNNMILCVVGDADFNEIVNFAEKNFGDEKGKVPQLKIKLKNGEKSEKRKGIDQANIVFAFHSPLAEDKKNYAAEVLSCLMGEGLSSRLFQELREKRNLCYAVKSELEISRDYAYSLIYIGAMKENVELIKELILEEFEKVAENFDEKELNLVKEQVIGNYLISMEDSQIQTINLLVSEINGNAETFYDFEKNISAVKLKDVKDLAKKAKEKFSFFVLMPDN